MDIGDDATRCDAMRCDAGLEVMPFLVDGYSSTVLSDLRRRSFAAADGGFCFGLVGHRRDVDVGLVATSGNWVPYSTLSLILYSRACDNLIISAGIVYLIELRPERD